MNTYDITTYDIDLMLQRSLKYKIKFEVLDMSMKVIDVIEGIVDGGSNSIDSSSDVRRTVSLTIVPTRFFDTNMVLDPKGYIWLDKVIHLYIGLYDAHKQDFNYYSAGYYYYTDVSGRYDTATNTLALSLNDFMVVLDGTKNGQLGGALSTVIPAYEENPQTGAIIRHNVIREVMISTIKQLGEMQDYFIEDIGETKGMEKFNSDYLRYRRNHPAWNSVPYDLEFNAGATIYEVVSALRDLYPNYEIFFEPIYNNFVCQLIPSREDDPIILNDDFFQRVVLSEDMSTSLVGIYNICEVWGEVLDASYYTESFGTTATYEQILGEYTAILNDLRAQITELTNRYIREVRDSSSALAGEIKAQIEALKEEYNEKYEEQRRKIALLESSGAGNDYAYLVQVEGYPDEYRSGDTIAIKINKPNIGRTTYIKVNSLGAIPVFSESTDQFIEPMALSEDTVYVFRIDKSGSAELPDTIAYLQGHWKVHAMDVLSNGEVKDYYSEPIPQKDANGNMVMDTNGNIIYDYVIPVDENNVPIMKYSEAYFRYKYNCEHVHITVVEDSPFAVQKIGELLDVKTGGHYENIQSDQVAEENAIYENWKNSRLTDNITIQTLLVPFLDVNTKVSYRPQNESDERPYIISSINHDFSNMTSSITMYRFYTMYQE